MAISGKSALTIKSAVKSSIAIKGFNLIAKAFHQFTAISLMFYILHLITQEFCEDLVVFLLQSHLIERVFADIINIIH